jgi:uncharacterized membrane protein
LSLRPDESVSYQDYAKESVAFVATHYYKPNNHIFHNVLVSISMRFLGSRSEAKIRLVVFFAGILLIPMFYFLSRKLLNHKTVWPACLLMIVCPVLVFYSVNARGYSFLVFFGIISFYASCQIYERRSDSGRIIWNKRLFLWEGVSVLSNSLALWTVPTHIFFVFAECMTWMLRNGLQTKTKAAWLSARLALTGILTFLLYLPLLIQKNGFLQLTANMYVKTEPRALPDCYQSFFSELSSFYFGNNTHLAVFFFSMVFLAIIFRRWLKNKFVVDFTVCYFTVVIVFISIRHVVPYTRTMIHFIPFTIIVLLQFLEFVHERIVDYTRKQFLPALLGSLVFLIVLTGFVMQIEKTVRLRVQYDIVDIADAVERFVVENKAIVGTDYPFNHPLSYYLDGRKGVSEAAARTFYPSDLKIERIYIIMNLSSVHYLMARTFLSMGFISTDLDFDLNLEPDDLYVLYDKQLQITWKANNIGSILNKYRVYELVPDRPSTPKYKMLHKYIF